MRQVFLFAIASAVLYSGLLPLWEGFDEPFHYAYVEWLAVRRQLPELNRSFLTAEIRRSLELAPVSYVIRQNVPTPTTFDQWFAMPREERLNRREQLERLSPALRGSFEPQQNYEAHQAPLAYLVLAGIDSLASGMPLLQRVLLLRVAASIASVMLLCGACIFFCRAVATTGIWRTAALVCIFETQMLWATIAHVTNDWLAIPVAAALLAATVMFAGRPQLKGGIACAALLGVGLLTKAYFLAFVPVLVALFLWRAFRGRWRLAHALACLAIPLIISGPWYFRNWQLYRTISGMQETAHGLGLADELHAAARVDWVSSAAHLARSSLWTGNNSFTTFSRATLDLELLLLLVAFALSLGHGPVPRWLLACFAAYTIALAYVTCVAWANTNGASVAASPWYSQVLLPAVFVTIFGGLQRSGTAGRVVAALLVAVNGWICIATYVAKLFPLYGGLRVARATPPVVIAWWLRDSAGRTETLRSLALAPPALLYALLALVLAGTVALTLTCLREILWHK